MQHVLSSRILPAFKRYAIGTEPVREAAKVRACVSTLIFARDMYVLVLDILL